MMSSVSGAKEDGSDGASYGGGRQSDDNSQCRPHFDVLNLSSSTRNRKFQRCSRTE